MRKHMELFLLTTVWLKVQFYTGRLVYYYVRMLIPLASVMAHTFLSEPSVEWYNHHMIFLPGSTFMNIVSLILRCI